MIILLMPALGVKLSIDFALRTTCLNLAAEKFGDSPIKSDMKLGPQTHLGAESQSYGTI